MRGKSLTSDSALAREIAALRNDLFVLASQVDQLKTEQLHLRRLWGEKQSDAVVTSFTSNDHTKTPRIER